MLKKLTAWRAERCYGTSKQNRKGGIETLWNVKSGHDIVNTPSEFANAAEKFVSIISKI